MKKLIVWDFDGVIADSEKLWVNNWKNLVNKTFNKNFNFKEMADIVAGKSIETKKNDLEERGFKISDAFLQEIVAMDIKSMEESLSLIPGIYECITLPNISHCVATGGAKEKTNQKISILGLQNIFNEKNVFVASMVERGKPAPDLFLFAIKNMGFVPEECVVVEDSIPGMRAAKAANVDCVAFLACEMNQTPEHLEKVKALGVKNIFYNASELKEFLESQINKD